MRPGAKMYMNKKRLSMLAAVTAAVVAAMVLLVAFTIRSVNQRIRRSCFDDLAVTATHLAGEFYTLMKCDHTALDAIAAIIQQQEAPDEGMLCQILGSFNFDASYISYLELLRPDNTVLDADGTVRDASGILDMADETAGSSHISNISPSVKDPDVKVIRHAVHIYREGEPAYILYGVIRLDELADEYVTDVYNGHAYVYLENGDNGNFILDTWNKTLGNIAELGGCKPLSGYALNDAVDDMRRGIGGEIAFISQATDSILYMHYEPTGINNWNVMLTVEERYAFEKSAAISDSLYTMAGVGSVVLLLYFVFVLSFMLSAYRQVQKLGTEDHNTGLLNRNAYDKYVEDHSETVLPLVTCIFADVNGLHSVNNEHGHAEGDRLLRTAADTLRQEFTYESTFRIGGDEFVAFSKTLDAEACSSKMQRIAAELEQKGCNIAYGVVGGRNMTGLDNIIREADAAMLKNKGVYYAKHDRRRG